jgi:pimeloyl-ACP methyl ester carboxylesterase
MKVTHATGLALLAITTTFSTYAVAEDFVTLAGAACTTPSYLHCPHVDCSADRVINQGPVVEMNTRRTYFLDYPCDLERGEPVTLVLSLHGGGSYGNWQRHYFPILDFKDKYRLVIATPNSPTRVWSEADDAYLQNIVESVVSQLGEESIKAFWLVGHSQGGMTANRILRTPFFSRRVDGWLSLSGGRLGGNPGRAEGFGPPRRTGPAAAARGPRSGSPPPGFAAAFALLRELPGNEFSFIYATGAREIDAAGVPATSQWAEKLGCDARVRREGVVDTRAGYVYDASRQDPPNPAWGLLPGPGTAEVFVYPECRDGRIVADVVRLDKGHTEGLEPNITEALVQLMVSARGGRIQHGS